MIGFVILHYKNITDTVECIDSILSLNTEKKISIVVVDNNTLNDSDEKILSSYNIDLIKLDDNMGFAKANNIGCNYLVKKYSPDFLCVINNDTVINQKDFIEKIYNCYETYDFDMLGPKIITDNGESVNPFPVYKNLYEIDNAIKKSRKLIYIYKSAFLTFLLNIYIKVKGLFIQPRHMVNGEIIEKNVGLHGCALVFSKKYYEKYDTVFYNETFLYHEEEFLYQRVIRDSLTSIYDPNIEIFHKEGASLNNSFGNSEREKLIFRNKEIVKSLNLLKQFIHKEEN